MASHVCCKVILLFIALICKISGIESNQCSDYGKLCDPYSHRPCCNSTFGCMVSNLQMTFACMEIGQLSSRCSRNDDCSRINNLECSKENICVCQSARYVEFNQICRPLLGGRCFNTKSCIPRNSICNNGICECDFNYFHHTENYCLPAILGNPCSNDTICQQVRFAKCSDKKICECKSNAGVINPSKCASLLNGFCLADDDCYHANSICVDKTCQCKPKHVSSKISTIACLPGYLNMTCPRHLQCDYLIDNTICSFDGQCICQSGYVPINESSCGLKFSANCFSNEICATVNAACIDNKCQCRANYVHRNDKCLPTFLNESCESDIDCIEIRHSICSKQKCVCEDGYRQINKTTCKIRTAGNFILDQLCFGNVECQGIAYARCIDNKCQCKPQYAKLNETACAPILGGFCWRDSPCAAVNAVCIDYWCQCRDGFLAQSYNKCIKNYLGSFCEKNGDCDMLHSKCSNNKCVCLSGYVPLNRTTCAPLLGAFCWRTVKCAPDNAVCVKNECQCDEGYSQQSDDRCLPTSLGQFCRVNSDCNAIKYSICFENTCICQPGSVPVGGNICKSLFNEICDNEDDCFSRNGACIDHKCKCRNNVLPQSNFKCPVGFVNTTYARMGIDDELKCSVDGICICGVKHAALNDTICAPGLGEDCNYLCLTDNAACIRNKCQCKLNYRLHARKFCKPTQLHLACAFDIDCDDIENAKCSNGECVCREKYAEVNAKTCRPLLGGFCWTDSDCITDNASCIDNRCQCSEYFTTENNSCLPIEKFCNVNADCFDIDNAECSDNVCKCKPNYRKFNTIMCEPLLGGSCRSDAQCRIPNSACLVNTCQCVRFYVANSNNQCALLTLGQPCIDNRGCKLIPHAVCSNKICTCKKNFMAFDEETCLPIIGGYCLEDIQCRYNTTECIDDKCQCKKSFKAVSSHQCRPKFSMSSCSDVTECGDRWHYQCSDGKCICAENNIFIDNWTCSPIIGGACWTDHQCVVQDSGCIDFRCQCKPNFVAIANNMCFKNTL